MFFVYLSAIVFRQKCKRHGLLAKPLMQDPDIEAMCGRFFSHLTDKLGIANKHEEKLVRLKREEKLRRERQMREEEEEYERKISKVKKGSTAYFEMIMNDYEDCLKKSNKEERKNGGNRGGGYEQQKTEGAHVFALCQACKMGVCQYFKKMKKP